MQLAEIDRFEDDVTFDDYLADFSGTFHDLRDAPAFADCLDPDSYVQSQALAERLLEEWIARHRLSKRAPLPAALAWHVSDRHS